MRQMSTNVRLRGNRGAGMAAGWLAGLNWAWYKTVQAARPTGRLPLRFRGSDPGSVFGLLPPGADAATKP
jgi:hypothetical protein